MGVFIGKYGVDPKLIRILKNLYEGIRPQKKLEIPITEPKKLGSVGRENFFFWKFFLLVFYGPWEISKIFNLV